MGFVKSSHALGRPQDAFPLLVSTSTHEPLLQLPQRFNVQSHKVLCLKIFDISSNKVCCFEKTVQKLFIIRNGECLVWHHLNALDLSSNKSEVTNLGIRFRNLKTNRTKYNNLSKRANPMSWEAETDSSTDGHLWAHYTTVGLTLLYWSKEKVLWEFVIVFIYLKMQPLLKDPRWREFILFCVPYNIGRKYRATRHLMTFKIWKIHSRP